MLIEAAVEVGPALFFSLLIITVSFLPIFALEAQEGRLFKPLAYTKTFAMAAAALLSVTLVPALMMLFVRGRIMPEHKNPVNRFLIWIYRPVIRLALRFKAATIVIALVVLAGSLWPAIAARQRVHADPQRGHAALHADHAAGHFGHQGGRAAADPGQDHQVLPRGRIGLGQGRPRRDRDRSGADRDVRDGHQSEAGERMAAGHDRRQADRRDGQGAAVSRRVQRLDHADQGAHRHALDRHPHAGRRQGVRHGSGRDGEARARRSRRWSATVPGTSSAYAERVIGGYYLDIDPDRAQLARYGLMVGDVQDVIAMALGAEPVTTTVEGRERYTVSIRYPRDFRSDPQAIATEVLVPLADGGTVPLGEVAKVEPGARAVEHPHRERPARRLHLCRSARPRPRRLRRRRAEGGGSAGASSRPATTSPGAASSNIWSAPRRGCKIVVPVTLLIIFLLLYLNFRRMTETLIVMLSVPFALVGGFWLMWWLGFNLSVAVAVGFIALAGVAAETGVVMLIYLDQRADGAEGAAREREGRPFTRDDLYAAIMAGAVERVRPKMMTVGRHHGGPAADHVEPRHRLRGDAAHRRADDRRHGVVDLADADRHSGDLCRGQRLFLALAAAEEGHSGSSYRSCLRQES